MKRLKEQQSNVEFLHVIDGLKDTVKTQNFEKIDYSDSSLEITQTQLT